MTIPVGYMHARGGYVHCRTRRQLIADALNLGIPAPVVHHKDLMTDGLKPSAKGYKVAEKLVAQVRAAQAAGQDPAPLWQAWVTLTPASP